MISDRGFVYTSKFEIVFTSEAAWRTGNHMCLMGRVRTPDVFPWRFDVGYPVVARCHFALSVMPDAQREWFIGLSVMAIEVVSRKLV